MHRSIWTVGKKKLWSSMEVGNWKKMGIFSTKCAYTKIKEFNEAEESAITGQVYF